MKLRIDRAFFATSPAAPILSKRRCRYSATHQAGEQPPPHSIHFIGGDEKYLAYGKAEQSCGEAIHDQLDFR
jgi:hypothetical protein